MAYFQTENLWITRHPDGVAELTLDVPGGKVNTLTASVLADLDSALTRVADDLNFRFLVIRTGKTASFCAGPPPLVLAGMTQGDFGLLSAQGQEVCNKLANLRLPSLAVISGGCLGGGLDLALACDYRLALNKRTTIFGFPELELGLIPMWGGTQRVVNLVGLERGLQMLLGSKRLLPPAAKIWGLIDDVTDEASPPLADFLNRPKRGPRLGLPLRTWRQKITESTGWGRRLLLRGAERLLRRRLPDDMPAPWLALDAVRTGLHAGFEAGLAREHSAAQELAASEACGNLVRLHLERDKLRSGALKQEAKERARNIGIVGAGTRGMALITMAVTKGFQVKVRESDATALGFAMFHVLTVLQEEVARGALTPADLKRFLGNIHASTAWKGFEELDLVLETGEDPPSRKAALFREIEQHTNSRTLLVTTGAMVTTADLQQEASRPQNVGALHFLPPVNRSLLVEVPTTEKAPLDTTRRLLDFVVALGRAPQQVKDLPGFLVQRLLLPYFNEAILLVKEGFNPLYVDEAMTRFGMNQGPLEQLDLLGLDAALTLVQALTPVVEKRLIFDQTFATMTERRWLGQKTKLGFYRYRGTKRKVHQAAVLEMLAQSHADAPHKLEAVARKEQLALIRRRLVWLMVNEAAWCLEEGRVESAAALDLALTLAGWAPHRGGPLRYARFVGVAATLRELEELADEHGPRYLPCPSWRAL